MVAIQISEVNITGGGEVYIRNPVKQEILDDDDVGEDSEGELEQEYMEYLRNKVKSFACPPNSVYSCDKDISGQVPDHISQLFNMYPDYNRVIFVVDDEKENLLYIGTYLKMISDSCKTQCEKEFLHTSIITQHVKTHTEKKPYQCSYCKIYFTGKSSL